MLIFVPMRREGDRGYILTGEEAARIVEEPSFQQLKTSHGIVVDLSLTSEPISHSPSSQITFERLFKRGKNGLNI